MWDNNSERQPYSFFRVRNCSSVSLLRISLEIYSLLLERLSQRKEKVASQLSGRDYDEMAICQADLESSLVPPDAQKMAILRELLNKYLRQILDLHIVNPNSNEDAVRAIMDNFFIEAVQLYLPFAVKERKDATYHSTLALPTEVTGKMDQVFSLIQIFLPIFAIEHKDFTVNLVCKFAPEVAQTFAQVMGMWERILKCLHHRSPKEVNVIITNGKEWILVRRYEKDDNFCNEHSNCVSAFRNVDNELTISEDGVNAILEMLHHSFTVAKNIESDFQAFLSNFLRPKGADDDTPSGGVSGAKLSNANLALHLRNPENTYENRSLQRFIMAAEYDVWFGRELS